MPEQCCASSSSGRDASCSIASLSIIQEKRLSSTYMKEPSKRVEIGDQKIFIFDKILAAWCHRESHSSCMTSLILYDVIVLYDVTDIV